MGLIRKLLPYTTIAVCIALLYAGWVFYSRYRTNAELQRKAETRYVEQAKRTYEMYGAGRLKILAFYAMPGVVQRGGTTELCYGVANATSVSIDNGIEAIKPSLSRCLPVKITRRTTYTLKAQDEQGNHVEQSVDVLVQ
jgi:hypothetical protein